MNINSITETEDALASLKGQKFIPHDGEGLVYIKLVMLKPDTMENGDPNKAVEEAPSAILCGQMSEIKNQIVKWFSDAAKTENQ